MRRASGSTDWCLDTRLSVGAFAVGIAATMVAPAVACASTGHGGGSPVAFAISLNPLSWITGAFGSLSHFVSSVLSDIVNGLASVLVPSWIRNLGTNILAWLCEVPNVAKISAGGAGDSLEQQLSYVALGIIPGTFTVEAIRFYTGAFSSRPSGRAFSRVAFAIIGILTWPWVAHNLIAIDNQVTQTLLTLPAVKQDIARTVVILFGGSSAFGGEAAGAAGALMVIFGLFLFIALICLKVMLYALASFGYRAVPIALSVYPIPELAGITRTVGMLLGICLLIPVAWALLFITTVGLSGGSLGAAGIPTAFMGTVAGVVSLALTLMVPVAMLKRCTSLLTSIVANGFGGGSARSHTAAYSGAGGGVRGVDPGSAAGMADGRARMQSGLSGLTSAIRTAGHAAGQAMSAAGFPNLAVAAAKGTGRFATGQTRSSVPGSGAVSKGLGVVAGAAGLGEQWKDIQAHAAKRGGPVPGASGTDAAKRVIAGSGAAMAVGATQGFAQGKRAVADARNDVPAFGTTAPSNLGVQHGPQPRSSTRPGATAPPTPGPAPATPPVVAANGASDPLHQARATPASPGAAALSDTATAPGHGMPSARAMGPPAQAPRVAPPAATPTAAPQPPVPVKPPEPQR